MQFCLTPGLLSTRSKVIKYKYVKNSNQIIEILTRKSDKNQLEPGKGVGSKAVVLVWSLLAVLVSEFR